MTRRRWMADEIHGDVAAVTGSHADHLVRVLRGRVGEQFDIASGDSVRRGLILSIQDGRVEFELGEPIPIPDTPEISLLLAIFKFDRMEWAIEKATELGTARIVPVIAHRSDRHLVSAASKRVDRWQRVALQAAEQSRRTGPPEVVAPQKIAAAAMMNASARILLSENEKANPLKDVLESQASPGAILLAVGPEGGWTPEEELIFQNAGWHPASLGTTILRAETAAIAALAITFSLRS